MRDVKLFGLRLPPDVRDWLKEAAQKNLRSQNAEVVLILRERMERELDRAGDAR